MLNGPTPSYYYHHPTARKQAIISIISRRGRPAPTPSTTLHPLLPAHCRDGLSPSGGLEAAFSPPPWSRRRTTSSFTNNLPLTHHFFLTVPRPFFSSTALYTWYNSWSVFLWRKGRRISSSSDRLHFATQTHHPPARCSRTSWVINVVLNNIHQQYPVVELACQAG